MVHEYTFQDSIFEFASAIETSRLSVGITGPDAPILILCTEIADMLFGRLEIYVVFVAGLKIIKDLKNILTLKKQ